MVRDKDQVLIYNKQQLELIKSVFGNNEDLLYLIRKVLLQFPMTQAEIRAVKDLMTPDIYEVIKMRLFPDLNPDAPLTQMIDMYQYLNKELERNGVETMKPLFEATKLQVEYFAQQFEQLKDIYKPVVVNIELDKLKYIDINNPYQTYVNTKARNFIIGYVDSFLVLIKTIAGSVTESPEAQKTRLTKESTK